MKSLLSLLVFVLVACQPKEPASTSQIDNIFKVYDTRTSPGAAMAVIQNGEVVFKKGYGMANLEYDIPNTPSTVFDIASVSKQFAGLAISTLAQEGQIAMTDDIRKYLPEVPIFQKPITIQHLINHTSGLRDWPQTLNVAGWRWDEIFSYEDILRMVKYQKDLDFEPGERFSYSNTGYNLLAAIVAKVSGKSFREWTDENIFAPLNMKSSHFLDNYKTIIKNMAYSYDNTGQGWVKSPTALTGIGSSSLFTSVEDLCLWVINFDKQVAAANPIYLRMLEQGTLNNGEKTGYAFGLGIDKEGGLNTVSHNGGWAGYRTVILNFPDEKLSVIALGNASDFNPDTKAIEVARLYLMDKFKADAKSDVKGLPTVKTNLAFAQKCTGMYQLGPGWYVTITLEGDRLMTQATREEKFPMETKSDSVYWIPGYNGAMTFVQDKDGSVNSVRYKWIRSAKRITPLVIDQSLFNGYAGIYHSDELGTEYTVFVAGDKLKMFHMRHGEFELLPDPAIRGQFSSKVGTVRFDVDENGKVRGLRIGGGRVNNLKFEKTKS